mgnify:CR=1 FL=1|jgi:tartronate-semialdehyde synthase
MQVAEAVVKILEKEGIEAAFGIPGAAINPVYKYLKNSRIKHYIARHEEGAIHAADGYYRASGKMALAICTSGPGATNFVTGLYTAKIDSMPLIAITGQASSNLFGKEPFQCVDIASIAKSVAKATWCVTNSKDLPKIMREAFYIARSGRPGPVLIDLPLDIQKDEIEFKTEDYKGLPIEKPTPDLKKISEAMDLIEKSKNSIMILGGGVILSGATEEFRNLAEYLSVPVIMTYMGKGGLPEEHLLNAGHAGIQVGQPIGNEMMLGSDLVIGVGCRFSDRHTGNLGVYTQGRKFIHIDIEPSQIGRVIKPDLGIVSDAKLALTALLEEAKKRNYHPEPTERVKNLPKRRRELARKTDYSNFPIKPQRVYEEINKAFPDNTMFTTGCGLTQIWSGQLQEINLPRRYLPSGGAGTLGYELPAAIGAKVASPNDPAVVVVGDAGLLFMIEELGMAGQHNIPIIIIVVNNGFLSLIRQNQKYAYDYEHAVSLWYNEDLENAIVYPDNVKIAEGFGAKAERVMKADDLPAAFKRALAAGVPYLIDVVVERETDCSMGGSIDKVREFV